MSIYFSSCEKDNHGILNDYQLENRYDSTVSASGSSNFPDNINFDGDGNILLNIDEKQFVIPHANIENQREASEFLFKTASFDYLKNFETKYGIPNWKVSLLSNMQYEQENIKEVIIPIIKDNNISAIIFYQNMEGYKNAWFLSTEFADYIVNNTDTLYYKRMFIPILKFQLLNLIFKNNTNNNYVTWLKNAQSYNNSLTLELRGGNPSYSRWWNNYCRGLFKSPYQDGTGGGGNDWGDDGHDWPTFKNCVTGEWEQCPLCSIGFPCPYHCCNSVQEDDDNENEVDFPEIDWGDTVWNSNWNKNGGNSSGGDENGGNENDDDPLDEMECFKSSSGFMGLNYVAELISDDALVDACNPDFDTYLIILNFSQNSCDKGQNLKNLDTKPEIDTKLNDYLNNLKENCCSDNIEKFKEKYGIDLTDKKYEDVYNSITDCTNQDKFDEEVVKKYIINSGCIDEPLYNFLLHLGVNKPEDILNFCEGESNSPLPDCEGCSVEEKQKVWGDHLRAREMLECAINKLENYDGVEPEDVKEALFDNYQGEHSKLMGKFMKFLLKYIKLMSVDCDYEVQNNGDGNCGLTTNAWSYPAAHFTNVRLCRPNYWDQTSDTERSGTLIHEWMHLYYVAGDWAYDFEHPEYERLSTLQQLLNADSFSEFVKQICP